MGSRCRGSWVDFSVREKRLILGFLVSVFLVDWVQCEHMYVCLYVEICVWMYCVRIIFNNVVSNSSYGRIISGLKGGQTWPLSYLHVVLKQVAAFNHLLENHDYGCFVGNFYLMGYYDAEKNLKKHLGPITVSFYILAI